MIKIAICDDEKMFCDSAERMLKLYMEGKDVPFQADVFSVPSELLDMTEKGTIYDIYLLDIYMPGITRMSIATELRSRGVKSPIIFSDLLHRSRFGGLSLCAFCDLLLTFWGLCCTFEYKI